LQKGGFNLDRNEYIGNLTSKTLLVFDDFGIERDTEYALEQIYNVINARYQKEKPTIITTNLDYKDLEKGGQDLMLSRIYSRIIEMGVPLKVDGSDRRKAKRMLKIEKAKNLMDK
jgi:DNA replication protein DnaC